MSVFQIAAFLWGRSVLQLASSVVCIFPRQVVASEGSLAQTLFGICEMLDVLVVSILQALAVTRTVIALDSESVALSFFFSII